jgi:glycosyltransferase involved in cell wall biosynthesis
MNLWIRDGRRHEQAASGYGQLAAGLAAGLVRLGHTVTFALSHATDACLNICPPSRIRHRPDVLSAAFTMHELETLPPDKKNWPDILNDMDLVLTPTAWNKAVWQSLGVRAPIEIVPLGVDDTVFAPPTGRTCIFLTVHENFGGASSRENWRDTILAYYSTFNQTDRVELVVKTWKWKRPGWDVARDDLAKAAGKSTNDLPHVTIIDDQLTAHDLTSLYHRAWLFVKNANREGWSLPCTEAAACGTQIAATNIQPLTTHLSADTEWFTPGDVKELSRLLSKQYRLFLAAESHSRLYTWDNTAALTARAIARHRAACGRPPCT